MTEYISSKNVSIKNRLDAYLLSKCSLSLYSNNKLAKSVKPNTNIKQNVTKLQSVIKEDLQPQKSGEIFRNKLGRFSFSCTFCDAVCENCQEIMDHINSHFEEDDSLSQLDIDMSPEFIAADKIKLDTIAPDLFQKSAEKTTLPKPSRGASFLDKKLPASGGSDDSEMKSNVETSKSSQKTPIIKIVKLKPVKLRPSMKTYAVKKKTLMSDEQESRLAIPKGAATPPVIMADQSSPIEVIGAETLPKLTKYVRKMINRCYQCEMEPRVYDPSDLRRHICLFCEKWFPNHNDYEMHVQNMHNKSVSSVRCYDFYCYVCEKKFPFRNYLTHHMKTHTSNFEHLCATCGLRFATQSRLNEHSKIHEDRTFECDQCGKIFKRFVRLRKHLWCHNLNLSFVCAVCSKAFKMKRYLDRHMAIHNEPKINCRYCDASFNFVSVRRAHEKTRHNVL